MVKCWDLEVNKVIRHYHGHYSGVYSLSVHPTLDVLCTAGRDASVRVSILRRSALNAGLGYADTGEYLHPGWS